MCVEKIMPICKNCKSRIDKFNKDRCPICGVEKPFEGVTSDTVEITTSLDVDDMNFKPRKKKLFLIFSICLGFFGVEFFYVYKKAAGVIMLFINALVIGAGGGFVGEFSPLSYGAAFGIFIALAIVINTVIGLLHFFTPNLKDGRGEFII